MYPASTIPTTDNVAENQTDQFGSGSRGRSCGPRLRQKRTCCQAAIATAAEPKSTRPTPMSVEPGWALAAGSCRKICRNKPNRATTNPRPITVIPVRTQASSVRSAAK